MLVLSRRRGQRLEIRGPVTLRVLAVDHRRVRLGFEGPGKVIRDELAKAIERDGARRADFVARP